MKKTIRLHERDLHRIINESVKNILTENNRPSDEARAIQCLETHLRNIRMLLAGGLDSMWSTFALKHTQDPTTDKMYRTIGQYIQNIETYAEQLKKSMEMTKSLIQQVEAYNNQQNIN